VKANEFIKKFGLDSFKAAMLCPQFKRYNYAILYSDEVDFSNEFIEKHTDYMFKTSEIKRIVESHELVKCYGGYDLAKNVMQITPLRKSSYDLIEKLKQAIADVESCK
jgi:hypothetical protein